MLPPVIPAPQPVAVLSADPRLRYAQTMYLPPTIPAYDALSGESAVTLGGSGSNSSDCPPPVLYDPEISPATEVTRPRDPAVHHVSKHVVRMEWSRSQSKAADVEIMDPEKLPLPEDM
jgi:hypothetical protein